MVASRDLSFLRGMVGMGGVSCGSLFGVKGERKRRIWAKWCLGVFMGCLGGNETRS